MRYTVQFTDGTEEVVEVGSRASYQSDDHLSEEIAKASSRPDDVDDHWPTS